MKSFSELPLSPAISQAIQAMGFKTPSPIQAQALPILLGPATDFVGLAATGTGKTATFGIPMIEAIDAHNRSIQALILCPTRELALQISEQIDLIGKYKGIKSIPIYGGASYGDQIRGMRSGHQIVVGTPGRIVDHLEKGTLKLQNIKLVVLDEADEMVSMGFKEALETILNATPRETVNTWLFSATMGNDVRKVADKFLRNPQRVQINRTEVLSSTVEQVFYATREANKPDILCKLIDAAEDFYGLVFCQTKSLVMDLTRYLNERGLKADCLHGDKSQNERERTLRAFKERRIKILIGTDVASRGLDVKDVTHVINYSIPHELDVYVHRIGRTARSGKKGMAMSLVTPSHRSLIARIEKLTNSKIKEGVLPTRKEIGQKKTAKLLEQFQNQPHHPRAMELIDPAWVKNVMEMTREEIISRFISLNLPEVFEETQREKISLGTDRVHSTVRNERHRERREQRGDRRPFFKRSGGGKHHRKNGSRHSGERHAR